MRLWVSPSLGVVACVRRACREALVAAGVPILCACLPVVRMVRNAVGAAVCGVLRALLAAAAPAECPACVACVRRVQVWGETRR